MAVFIQNLDTELFEIKPVINNDGDFVISIYNKDTKSDYNFCYMKFSALEAAVLAKQLLAMAYDYCDKVTEKLGE